MASVRPPFRSLICLMLLVAAVEPCWLLAQANQFEGKVIADVQFVPLQQPLSREQLDEMVTVRKGQPLRMEDVRNSIERLYATGRYQEIEVDAESSNGGVVVRFFTKNSWFIGHVGAAGEISSPPNRGQLVNAAGLGLGLPYTDEKLEDARNSMRQLLEANGLYGSTVQPVLDYDTATQQVHIRFDVTTGKRAKYDRPVLQGDLKLDTEKIISATKWRRWIIGTWKPVTQARTRRALDGVRELYEKEGRLEAKVNLTALDFNADTNRVRPTLTINAGPKIEVRTFGDKLSRKTLRRYLPIFQEHTIDRSLLVEGARNLENYYQSEGYFEAQVQFKEQRVRNDRAAIDYLINKGNRFKLVHIEIKGNRYFDTGTLRERMFLRTASLLQFRHGRYSAALLRRDLDAITNLYRSNGFRDVSVTARTDDNFQGKPGDLAVFIDVAEGPQYLVSKLEISGVNQFPEQEIRQMLSSVEGQPFSEFNVAVDRDTILARYFANGFPQASFEWNSRPGAQPNEVEVSYVIREGQQQFVRDVLISGLKTTKPDFINRNLSIGGGNPLSLNQMFETQRKLYDLGIFAKVDTAIQNPDGDTYRKYVLYDMEEAREYSLGVGFGAEVARIGGCATCLDAPAGQAGFSPRISLDVSRTNLWGIGHSISFRNRYSTLQRRSLLNYSAPRFRNREGLNVAFTGLFDDSRDVRTFSSKRLEGSVQLSQRWNKATTLFYRYTYRRVSVDQNTLKITPLLIPLLSQPVRLGLVAGNVVHDRRDDPLDPQRGIYNTLDVGVAERIFGAQRNFVRLLARNATYHRIGQRYVLARNSSFGILHAFRYSGNALEAIPLAERFFGGGGTSHRGFPENQAGPRDSITGFPLGGNALLFNQVELRYPLIGENISGVLFHDAGNIYTRLSDISLRQTQRTLSDFNYMVHAVGFGLRYRTPIGPIRVDLAYSINPPQFFGFKGTREELINAGVNPCAQPGRCVVQSVSHFQFFFSLGQTF